jgi:hypothetical protein
VREARVKSGGEVRGGYTHYYTFQGCKPCERGPAIASPLVTSRWEEVLSQSSHVRLVGRPVLSPSLLPPCVPGVGDAGMNFGRESLPQRTDARFTGISVNTRRRFSGSS